MTDTLRWTPDTVALGELKPWAENPRMSSKAQAKRLLQSWRDFGQVHAIAIGPNGEVYDGHQRLSALLTVYGPDYEVDVRRASRELSDVERRALVINLHAGAVGSWDWDELANWDPALLADWGMDDEFLQQLNRDTAALVDLIGSQDAEEESRELDSTPMHLEDQFAIIVECKSEEEQAELLARLLEEGYECKALLS